MLSLVVGWNLSGFGYLPCKEIWIPLPINFVASGGAVAFDGYLLNRRGIPDLYPYYKDTIAAAAHPFRLPEKLFAFFSLLVTTS